MVFKAFDWRDLVQLLLVTNARFSASPMSYLVIDFIPSRVEGGTPKRQQQTTTASGLTAYDTMAV